MGIQGLEIIIKNLQGTKQGQLQNVTLKPRMLIMMTLLLLHYTFLRALFVYTAQQGDKVKKISAGNFAAKFFGPVKRFLVIDVHRNKSAGNIRIKQSSYIRNVINNFNMDDCNPISQLIEPGNIFQTQTIIVNKIQKIKVQYTYILCVYIILIHSRYY